MKPRAVTARIDRKIARAAFLGQPGTRKEREIAFAGHPPGQAERAFDLLSCLEFLKVEKVSGRDALRVEYEVFDYTLEELEDLLREKDFQLGTSLYDVCLRTLAYYCEGIQLHNMQSPQRLIKKSNEAYVQAWAQHPHGDHDDTPVELRYDK